MLGWDRHLESWVAGHRVAVLDPVFRGLTYAGTWGAVWIAIAAAVAIAGRRRQVVLWVVVADLAAQLSAMLLQELFRRSRPDGHALVARLHSHSFPSGHAASSFACAVVLASFVPRWRVPLYALAALIAFSRVYVGVHFPLDVIAGAVWGVILGKATLEAARLTGRRRTRSGSRETQSAR